jgi:hypothetical protein
MATGSTSIARPSAEAGPLDGAEGEAQGCGAETKEFASYITRGGPPR